MTTEDADKREGLRRGRIRGPWAYLIVATPVIVFLFVAAYLVSALT